MESACGRTSASERRDRDATEIVQSAQSDSLECPSSHHWSGVGIRYRERIDYLLNQNRAMLQVNLAASVYYGGCDQPMLAQMSQLRQSAQLKLKKCHQRLLTTLCCYRRQAEHLHDLSMTLWWWWRWL